MTARTLATSKVGSVVLAVANDDPAFYGDPSFSQIIVGVATALETSDLDLTLLLASSMRGRARLERLLRARRADGVMLLAFRNDDPLHLVAESSGLPTVFCGRGLTEGPRWYVDADNRGGGRRATEHLLSSGRSRIATITGPMDLEASVARYRGFTDAMAVVGLRVLKAHGRSVPTDVAVVGFDDLAVAQQTDLPLTAISQPIRDLGHEMATMLIRLMDGECPSPIILPTRPVVRGSAPTGALAR